MTEVASAPRLVLRIIVGVVSAVVVALVIGIPTGVIETPWYSRMTPVLWWNYPVWATASVLAGAMVATYVDAPRKEQGAQRTKGVGGTLLSLFAVGCPICNKVVVMALGASGAMTWFAPAQPLLAAASLGLLVYALRARVRSNRACALPAPEVDPIDTAHLPPRI